MFNECLFGECLFESVGYFGTWIKSFSFTYVAGATVFVKITPTATIPLQCSVRYYASEDQITWVEIYPSVTSSVFFSSSTSGTSNLYIKIATESHQVGTTPIISSLGVLISQGTSLYTMAEQVLADALAETGSGWDIDHELQNYPIDYAWTEIQTHRDALKKIAQACGGTVSQNRNGTVIVRDGTFAGRQSAIPTDTILDDRVYEVNGLTNDVINKVSIKTWPYKSKSSTTVWESSETFEQYEIKTISATYDYDGAINCVLSAPGLTVNSVVFYAKTAVMTLYSTSAQTVTVSITGNPLVATGSETVTASDGDSIRRYGEKALIIDDNIFIQARETAQKIADAILLTNKTASRDFSIDWRGDPANEVYDIVKNNDILAAITAQEITFTGVLSMNTTLRRI